MSENELLDTVRDFAMMPPERARAKYDLGPDAQDWKVSLAQADLRESGLRKDKVARLLYRPFDVRLTYYTGHTRGFICRPRHEVMRHMIEGENIGLITTRQTRDRWDVVVSQHMCGHKSCAAYDISSVFPLYLYPKHEDRKSGQGHLLEAPPWPPGKGGRVPNLDPEFVAALGRVVGLRFVSDGNGDLKKTVGPEDILHFLYALLQSPTYRSRFSEFLKRDFPRIFLVPDRKLFHALCTRGRELVDVHLLREIAPDVVGFPEKGTDEVGNVGFTPPGSGKRGGRIYINETQFFAGVLPEVWEFEVGGYQVCEKWLKDRKGRSLSHDEKTHYRRVVAALARTIDLRAEIDSVITAHGSWPLAGTPPSVDYGLPVGKGEERVRRIAEADPEKA